MQLERTNCKRNALICMQIRLKGSHCVCVCVCVALSVWLPRLDIKPKAEIVYTYTCPHTYTYGGGKAATIKAELTVGRLNDCRATGDRDASKVCHKYEAHKHAPPHTHTPTRKTVCKLLCVTLTYRVARWPVLLTIQIVFSLWFLFFFLLTYMPSGWGPCCVLSARLNAGNACFLRLLYAYLMSAVRWVYHNNNDVHSHTHIHKETSSRIHTHT